jgi:hypothetical protein
LVLFFLDLIAVVVRLFSPDWLGPEQRPEMLLVLLAAIVVVHALALELPAQNVIAAFCLALVLAAGLVWLRARMGTPGGQSASELHVTKRCWLLAIAWVSVLLICRSVSRLALTHLSSTANFGFYVLGLTVLLSMLLGLNLGPFVTLVKHYWSWAPAVTGLNWYGVSLIDVVAWAVSNAIILVLITAWLINKRPASGRIIHAPLWVWLSIQVLLLTGAVIQRLWAAAVLSGLQMVLIPAVVAFVRVRPARGKSEIRNQS